MRWTRGIYCRFRDWVRQARSSDEAYRTYADAMNNSNRVEYLAGMSVGDPYDAGRGLRAIARKLLSLEADLEQHKQSRSMDMIGWRVHRDPE